MTLITLLICLAVQRYTRLPEVMQRIPLLSLYFNKSCHVLNKYPVLQNYVGIILILLPVIILVALIDFGLHRFWHGSLAFVWHLVILYFCIDAQNLNKKLAEYLAHYKSGDLQAAYMQGSQLVADESVQNMPNLIRTMTRTILAQANQYIFAVIFWYIVLGPTGAIIYYGVNCFLAQIKQNSSLSIVLLTHITMIKDLIDWIPARIIGISYALVGHFNEAIIYWREHFRDGLTNSAEFAVNSALAALQLHQYNADNADIAENTQALYLIDRAIILWLVIVAITTLGTFIS